MFDVFTILQDHGMLFLMGQYPNGPLGGVLCTLLISLLAVVLSFPLGVLVGRRPAGSTPCAVSR